MDTIFKRVKSSAIISALFACAIGLTPIASQATPYLKYSLDGGSSWNALSGSNYLTANCSGSACGAGTNITDFVATGITSGSATDPFMDLSNFNMTTSGAAHIIVEYSVTDFSTPQVVNLVSAFSGNYHHLANMTLSSYLDSSNSAYGKATQLYSVSDSGSGAIGSTSPFAFSSTSPYSLTLIADVMLPLQTTSYSFTSTDQSIHAIPEPSNLGMMGVGLVLIGLLGLRMRQAKYRNHKSS